MNQITLDLTFIKQFVNNERLQSIQEEITHNYSQLIEGNGKGNEFLGWLDLPKNCSVEQIEDIINTANELRSQSEVIVVIGIGGSYLGSRAIIEALYPHFERKSPQIVFAGHHLDVNYHYSLLKWLDNKDYSIVIISKSGTTTEPAIAFRLLREHLYKKYGEAAAAKRIVAITDSKKGTLKSLSTKHGYKTFDIPDNVGGRYSVLTPVGLLPIAIAGFDIKELLKGAHQMRSVCFETDEIDKNIALQYAAIRTILYRMGFQVELMVSYNPSLSFFAEWWKQLFGESEGKDKEGLFPASANFTTDLHSLGQYIQDGSPILFETIIDVKNSINNITIEQNQEIDDGLNFLSGKKLSEINSMAMKGTIYAHSDGGTPNLVLTIDKISEETLGALVYFFEFACGVSAYTLGVNPFDQPGVEQYKNNMFALLEKPGYEKYSEELFERFKEEE